jgi:pantothenate kinase-related protein Tda10
MKKINVVVSGCNGSGKSAVALLIQKTLRDNGITATLNDDNGIGIVDEAPGVIESSLEPRLKTIGKTTVVDVVTFNNPA